MIRNEYSVSIVVNGRHIRRVIIDSHYKLKHPEMNDEIILRLVKKLAGFYFRVEKRRGSFEYFKVEPVELDFLPYRVVFVLSASDDFLGVINAFRVRRKK